MERLENMADGMNHPEGTENESKLYRRHFALKGVENHRLFEIVEESPAITKADAEKKAGRNRGALKQNFEDLIASDVIREIDGSLYMGLEAIAASHGRDRGPDDIVHGDYSKYLDSQTEFREQQQWHDRTLVRVQSRLEDMGIYSVQGRRLNIGYKTSKEEMGVNSTTLKPDLWVAVPTDDGDMVWHALELDRSVYSISTRQQKRRPLLAANLNHNPVPYLFIADRDTRRNWSAGQRANAMRMIFGDLPMLATTLPQFLTGDFFGPASVWHKSEEGKVADINYLANLFEEDGLSQYIYRRLGRVQFGENPEGPR